MDGTAVRHEAEKILAELPERISDVIKPFARQTPDHPALMQDDVTWTYAELAAAVADGVIILSRPSRNQTGISNALHPRPYGLFLDDLPIHIRPDLPAARVQT